MYSAFYCLAYVHVLEARHAICICSIIIYKENFVSCSSLLQNVTWVGLIVQVEIHLYKSSHNFSIIICIKKCYHYKLKEKKIILNSIVIFKDFHFVDAKANFGPNHCKRSKRCSNRLSSRTY